MTSPLPLTTGRSANKDKIFDAEIYADLAQRLNATFPTTRAALQAVIAQYATDLETDLTNNP